ncbi:MAG: acyl-CoA thioesterase [Bacteroidales bacterium]|jgi:acyl-CoA hydrolase|nr:hypothetical protein [Bacteroidales bacterium]MCK9499516.1 hypothetical protein [Bacteroidales bacterium]MDY0314834.1 hotdog domain-containing protein [Bacteroidales bacterium]NLB86290.1 acyl-CoA thioesterase [Bacteroidales bacterium]
MIFVNNSFEIWLKFAETFKMQAIEISTTKVVMPKDLNSNSSLFGGQLLKWMDEQAYICAKKCCSQNVVTVRISKVDFKTSAKNGDIINIISKLIKIKGASLELKVEASLILNENKVEIANAEFLMAAIDEDGKPKRLV